MKRYINLLSNGFAVSLLVFAAAIAEPSRSAVVASSLEALRIDGKISDVLWTRRADTFTLQVLMPVPPRGNDWPKIDVWLLRADGSHMQPTGTSYRSKCGRIRCAGSEVEYLFSLDAGNQAAKVVLSVDGTPYTDRLQPLGN